MKEKNRINYFFIIFIFLAILFFINTDTVFAKVGSGSSSSIKKMAYVPVESLQQTTASFCKIYTSSNYVHKEQQQFHLGWKVDVMSNKSDFYNNTAQAGSVAWTTFNNLIAYPNIILFEERWKQSTGKPYYKRSTGYLYLYVDEYEAKQQAAVWASYANPDGEPYLPLYYQNSRSGQEEKGEAFFGLRGSMHYLPLSNIKNNGAYYSQNFTTQSETDAVKILEKIMTEGDSKQEVSGWQCWSDSTPFLMGNLLTGAKAISSKYKWVSMFAIGAMGENTYNQVGVSYIENNQWANKEYKVKKETVEAGFNGLASELGVSVNSQEFKSLMILNLGKILFLIQKKSLFII